MRLPSWTVFRAAVILSTALCLRGETISEFTSGTGPIDVTTYAGQAFLVLGSGSYTNISFNFFTPSGSAYSIGTAYLFSTPYTGSPSGLSSAPGYLGSAPASNGVYDFGTTATLTAGNTYYLFEDTPVPAGSIVGASPTTPEFYQAENANGNFGAVDGTTNFLVTGLPPDTASAVPEPSSLMLIGFGLIVSVALSGISKRRCQSAKASYL
jgi:hypothetical protein